MDADFYGRICLRPFGLPMSGKTALWHADRCINGPLAKGLRVVSFNHWNFAPAIGGNRGRNCRCNSPYRGTPAGASWSDAPAEPALPDARKAMTPSKNFRTCISPVLWRAKFDRDAVKRRFEIRTCRADCRQNDSGNARGHEAVLDRGGSGFISQESRKR